MGNTVTGGRRCLAIRSGDLTDRHFDRQNGIESRSDKYVQFDRFLTAKPNQEIAAYAKFGSGVKWWIDLQPWQVECFPLKIFIIFICFHISNLRCFADL